MSLSGKIISIEGYKYKLMPVRDPSVRKEAKRFINDLEKAIKNNDNKKFQDIFQESWLRIFRSHFVSKTKLAKEINSNRQTLSDMQSHKKFSDRKQGNIDGMKNNILKQFKKALEFL